jgi:hypothetical protein
MVLDCVHLAALLVTQLCELFKVLFIEDKQKLGTALQADDLQEITAAEVAAMFAAEEG